jgi:hypothetical protein
MKRIATWTFYGIGALAIIYLALYAYAALTGRGVAPGDPIHIFRKPGGVDVTLAMPNPGRYPADTVAPAR